jgi:hypothetical protein
MSKENEKRKAIEVGFSGIQCDNSKCDYTEDNVKHEDYKDWVDTPCPKCGENLLTEEDYQSSLKMIEAANALNVLADLLGVGPSDDDSENVEHTFRIQSDTNGGLFIKEDDDDIVDPFTAGIVNAMLKVGVTVIENTKKRAQEEGKTFADVIAEDGGSSANDIQEIGELLNEFPECAQKAEWSKSYEELLESFENAMKGE